MMGTNVHDVLEAARSLPAHEQLEILQGLAQSLAQAFPPLDSASAEFWQQRPLDMMAAGHATPIITDIRDLAIADWPDDEASDDLLTYLRASHDTAHHA